MELTIGIIAGVLVLGLLAWGGWQAYAKSQKARGKDQTVREQLEEAVRREKTADIIGAGPIPLSISEQLKRLRSLRERLHRRRYGAVPDDDVRRDG
jgi:predicted oxidoreductase